MQFSKLLSIIAAAMLVAVVFAGLQTVRDVSAAEPPPEQWNRTFGGADYDDFRSVQQTADGGYAAVAITKSLGTGGNDAWLVKADSLGNEQWNKTFGGSGNDVGYTVRQTIDRGYIIVGFTYSFGLSGGSGWLIKTDADGILL